MRKKEELFQKAVKAIEEDGAINSSVIGADSNLETRLRISDLLYPQRDHKGAGSQAKGARIKIRIGPR